MVEYDIKYEKGKVDLVGALHLADVARGFGASDVAGLLRNKVIKTIEETPDQKNVYVAHILGKAKRRNT